MPNTSGLDTIHPEYSRMLGAWVTLRDIYRGEVAVKEKGLEYLPATPGMVADGLEANQLGRKRYEVYLQEALFPAIVRPAVEAMLGVMHSHPPTIKLPSRLEPLRYAATDRGETLEQLLCRINENQLIYGRCALLSDVPSGASVNEAVPYMVLYSALRFINWDDGSRGNPGRQFLNLAVFDESEWQRGKAQNDFEWEYEKKYRVCVLGDLVENEGAGEGAVYRTGVFEDDVAYSEDATLIPSIGGRSLDQLPVTVVNTRDIVTDTDEPPLDSLARVTLAIYRMDARHTRALNNTAEDTLVVMGGSSTDDSGKPRRIGAGASIDLPSDGRAEYVGPRGVGLAERRERLTSLHQIAQHLGARLLDTAGAEAESGEALRLRVASRTASLAQIALTGAQALENQLVICGRWLGLPDSDLAEISVDPNMEFTRGGLNGRELVDIMSARQMGLPISLESIYSIMRRRGVVTREYDEELAIMEQEAGESVAGFADTGDRLSSIERALTSLINGEDDDDDASDA